MTEDVTPENIESVLDTKTMIEELENDIKAIKESGYKVLPSRYFLGAVAIRLKKLQVRNDQLEFQLRQKLIS